MSKQCRPRFLRHLIWVYTVCHYLAISDKTSGSKLYLFKIFNKYGKEWRCLNIKGKYLVRLSLLTMTNPNQLCDVLLFVCSKMADETNLSSKLPVADRTREV